MQKTQTNFSTFIENFIKAPKTNRLAYKKLISTKQSSPGKSQALNREALGKAMQENKVLTAVFSAPKQ